MWRKRFLVNKNFMEENSFLSFFELIYFHEQQQTQHFENTFATSLFCSIYSVFMIFVSDLPNQTSREAHERACGLGSHSMAGTQQRNKRNLNQHFSPQ